MATPESKVKQKIKRRLEKQAKKYGVTVRCDVPAASQYGVSGRPDLYIDFGSLHFRIEVKADKTKHLSPTQKVWHAVHEEYHSGIPVYVIKGDEQMEEFFGNFDEVLRNMYGTQISALEKQWHEVE